MDVSLPAAVAKVEGKESHRRNRNPSCSAKKSPPSCLAENTELRERIKDRA